MFTSYLKYYISLCKHIHVAQEKITNGNGHRTEAVVDGDDDASPSII